MTNALALASFKLPAVLDLAAASDLLHALRNRPQNGGGLCIDASEVETCTLPCIQVLMAALQSDSRTVIERPSAEFASAFEDLGLDWGQGREPVAPPEQTSAPAAVAASEPAPAVEPPVVQPVAVTKAVSPQGSKRILTIDDSKTMRDMLMLTLADAGFVVLQAVDGQDGLDVLGRESVDVIITDINMPRMDGYEVIRQLRRDPAHKSTPVLVLTTESELEKKNLARDIGATGWMVKPFDPDRLISTINKVAF